MNITEVTFIDISESVRLRTDGQIEDTGKLIDFL
jgi:hypothetical protein